MRGFESHPYIPNSVPDVQAEMLKEIGMSSLEELHKNVPELLKLKEEMNLPEAFGSEYELRRHVERLLSKDTDCKKNLNFLGAGCWCKLCEKNCPSGAVTVTNFLAHIDAEKCTNCGICAEKCPRKSIVS